MNTEYHYRLLGLLKSIKDPFEKEVFHAACKRLQDYDNGLTKTKHITKEEIIKWLIERGMMSYRLNKQTGKIDTLPDDRPVRTAARKLLKAGFPLVATSSEAGYFIASTAKEIDAPEVENDKKAMDILETKKGYHKARMFILGQESFIGGNL